MFCYTKRKREPNSPNVTLLAFVLMQYRGAQDAPGWDSLVGYADVKQEIEDTLVMPLRHPVRDLGTLPDSTALMLLIRVQPTVFALSARYMCCSMSAVLPPYNSLIALHLR